MDANRIHDDITHLLYKVEEQYSRILQYKESIPMVEVDLALKDVRDLYESMLDLRTLAEHQRRKATTEAAPAPTQVAEPIAEPVNEPLVEVKAEVISEPEVEEVQPEKENVAEIIPIVEKVEEKVVATEPVAQPKTESIQEEIKAAAEKLPEASPIAWQKTFDGTQAKEEVAKPIVAEPPAAVVTPKVDLLQERQKDFVPTVRKIEFKPESAPNEPKKESIFEKAASLYDKIAKPSEKTVANQATRQPISNIKSSIGINEKFAYLKDLFKNNVNEYNEALDKLNNFENYGEAEDFFQELKAKYNWDPESKSFQGLADLLNRRYLHNA
jgi:hypothetical protein